MSEQPKQVWGFDARGSSGYTKHMALLRHPTGQLAFVIQPAIATPALTIMLTEEAAQGLRDVLSGYSIA